MRHPTDGFKIPEAMRRILAYLASRPEATVRAPRELAHEHASLLYDLAPELLDGAFGLGVDSEPGAMRELDHLDTPFELAPVAWNGGDGLHYDWVVHAPELDAGDFPMVSFAPGEDGAVWLGDTTAQGLGHLLVAQRKSWRGDERDDPLATPMWEVLLELIGSAPDPDDPRITEGARSELFCQPVTPAGYRFEDGPDGIGVLAPSELFGDVDFADMPADVQHFRRESERLATEGRAAGALVLLKNLRSWYPEDLDVITRMREQYLALGRTMHAGRAERWLERRGP